MAFKLDDLYSLKEVQKIVQSKDICLEILNKIAEKEKIIKINNTTNEVTIILDENFTAFNFINVPNKMKKKEPWKKSKTKILKNKEII